MTSLPWLITGTLPLPLAFSFSFSFFFSLSSGISACGRAATLASTASPSVRASTTRIGLRVSNMNDVSDEFLGEGGSGRGKFDVDLFGGQIDNDRRGDKVAVAGAESQ